MFDARKATPLPARWCCALLALPLLADIPVIAGTTSTGARSLRRA